MIYSKKKINSNSLESLHIWYYGNDFSKIPFTFKFKHFIDAYMPGSQFCSVEAMKKN